MKPTIGEIQRVPVDRLRVGDVIREKFDGKYIVETVIDIESTRNGPIVHTDRSRDIGPYYAITEPFNVIFRA